MQAEQEAQKKAEQQQQLQQGGAPGAPGQGSQQGKPAPMFPGGAPMGGQDANTVSNQNTGKAA
jgi:hypothetical protein